MNHSYLTIAITGESLYKVKGSKHLGFAMPVNDEQDIKDQIEALRKTHSQANHVCYAWRLGVDTQRERANDDGEPSNSAGPPILGQIEKYQLTQVLVAVVRYFGGTKLGVGGLIEAYRTAAQLAIEAATIEQRKLQAYFRVSFPYARMGDVMLAARTQGWHTTDHDFREQCALTLAIDPGKEEQMQSIFAGFPDIRFQFTAIR